MEGKQSLNWFPVSPGMVLRKSRNGGEGQCATACKELNLDSKRPVFKSHLCSYFMTVGKCLPELPSYTMGIKSQSSDNDENGKDCNSAVLQSNILLSLLTSMNLEGCNSV